MVFWCFIFGAIIFGASSRTLCTCYLPLSASVDCDDVPSRSTSVDLLVLMSITPYVKLVGLWVFCGAIQETFHRQCANCCTSLT